MQSSSWQLLGEDSGGVPDGWQVAGQGWWARSRVARGGIREGVPIVSLAVGDLEVDVLPTRGMGLHAARAKGVRFGWDSPVAGPVHPAYVPLQEPSGLGWLDGFDEWLVRCGLESNGAPQFDASGKLQYPLHGRIANRPAREVELRLTERGGLEIRGVVDETRFHFSKLRLISSLELLPDRPVLIVRDTIENLSESPATAQLLYHINFGPPLLGEGARTIVAAEEVVPRTPDAAAELDQWDRMPAPEAGVPERVYFFRPRSDRDGWSRAALVAADESLAATISFQTSTLPCFSLWKNPTALADGYVTGLEPATNYPNPRGFEEEQGRVVHLEPRGRVSFQVELGLWVGADAVRAGVTPVEELAQPAPQLHAEAPAGWIAE